jgi:glutathione reductase (NADPH)
MPPFQQPTQEKYDYIIIGGGSGGSGGGVSLLTSFQNSSSAHCIELASCSFVWQEGRCGRGTRKTRRHVCQRRVCPQESECNRHFLVNFQLHNWISKIMWHAADLADKLKHAPNYHFTDIPAPTFSWSTFKPQRDAYIQKLNGIYDANFNKEGVDWFHGQAKFTSATSVEVTRPDQSKFMLQADHITIATGGRPTIPSDDTIPGASLGIDSDGFFDLEEQPKRVAVVGAGYIAVELAGVLHTLGSETHLLIRHDKVLRTFDPMIQDTLTPWMEKTGINIHKKTNVVKVEKGNTITVHTDKGDKIEVDVLLWASGRHANTENLGLEEIGLKLGEKGDVIVDEYQNTNVKGITSIGDVQGKALLTPVAIAAGRKLSNRLFGPEKFKDDKLDYTNIPTVVFS